MTRKIVLSLLALAAALTIGGDSLPAAHATEGSCNPGRANVQGDWQFGFAENRTDIYVEQADLSNYFPYYSSALTPFGTTQWIMLSGSGGSFIQIGWNQTGLTWGNHVQFMEAYNATTGADTYLQTGQFFGANTMATYEIYQDAANLGEYHLYIDGTQIWTYTFTGGAGNIMHSPIWAQVYAETQNEDEQVPGGTSSNDFVRNAELDYGSSSIQTLTGTVQDDGSWGGSTPAAGNTANGWMNLWDKACSA